MRTLTCAMTISFCFTLAIDSLKGQELTQIDSTQVTSNHGFRNVGIKECAACHSGASPVYEQLKVTRFVRLVEAKEWMQDKHAYAYELIRSDLGPNVLELPDRTSNQLSFRIQERLGWKPNDGKFEHQCLSCHTGFDPKSSDQQLETVSLNASFGVQCESCHGPGSNYLQTSLHQQVTWRSKTPQEKALHGMWDMTSASTATKVCASCHVGNVSQGRYVTHEMYAAGHPVLPPFELQTFMDAMPPHWKSIQEKPLRSATDREPPDRFDLQSEYYAAHFDLQDRSDVVEQTIRSSFERTKRSMIGGLVVHDLSLELLSELGGESDPYRWGDFANYDCMGCHQDLKRNSSRSRMADRIPGRPFPAPWLTLDRPKASKTTAQDFQNMSRQIAMVFNQVPFGSRSQWQSLAEAHRPVLQMRWKSRVAAERQPMTLPDVQEWLRELYDQRSELLDDYYVAKQTGWMIDVAIRELVAKKLIAPERVNASLDELSNQLRLDIKTPKTESLLKSQPLNLAAAQKFDAERCRVLMNELIRTAGAR